ncbi:conserved exported hypothetical protein [Desulfamplus magnetovallimortis]|uniref:Uncharacterized protein n=1 Tax=Desulfamplus magnetovallimortis TaxID=1246637 RepID=A0A1W1HC60_9BACT|nr:hypothetical protein [Desulfamplus magnetovallimortis]SLM30039.1 conserved exported hypothetical protein [Desulfamplus magnetovallimortis]
MKSFIKKVILLTVILSISNIMLSISNISNAMEMNDEYVKTKMCFENFIRCELTRTDAEDHFKGKSFKIIMINLFDALYEGDILIATGAVKCWVEDHFEILFIAVGVKELMGQEKVYYYLTRKNDFQILATELMNFPYKERCPWDRYWLNLK